MNIEEFRSQYPQYNEIDDETLSQKLHQKSYVGKIGYDDFRNKFLMKKTGVGAAFGAGIDKIQEIGYRAVKGFTETGEKKSDYDEGTVGSAVAGVIGQGGALSKWADEGVARNLKEQADYSPTVKSYKDIDSLGDAASYVGELTAQSAPLMAATFNPVGLFTLGGGMSNEAYESQEEKDPVRALASGYGQVAAEKIGALGSIGKLNPIKAKGAAGKVAESAVTEGTTEVGQELLAQWGAGTDVDELDYSNLDESFVGGAAVGGTLRGGAEIGTSAYNAYNGKPVEQVKPVGPSVEETLASGGNVDLTETSEPIAVNYDIPTVARQAGIDVNGGSNLSQFSEQFVNNASMRQGNENAQQNAMVPVGEAGTWQPDFEVIPQQTGLAIPNTQVNQVAPYTYEGEFEPRRDEPRPSVPVGQVLESPVIDGEFERQRALPDRSNVIYGEDGRPQQEMNEYVSRRKDQVAKENSNLLPQKDIIFAKDDRNLQFNSRNKPFASERAVKVNRLYKEAIEQGEEVRIIPINGGGYAWEKMKDTPIQNQKKPTEQKADIQGTAVKQSSSIKPIDKAYTTNGRAIDVEYQVVEAGDLIASNNDTGEVNKNYPQMLQPRDRNRATSEIQINKIANQLNPQLLSQSATTSDGAPIVSSKGVVESGNGRTLAIRRAYKLGKAQEYRNFLESQGYDVGNMQNPMLVRVRKNQMTDKELLDYTKESNESNTLTMSSSEKAISDAKLVGPVIYDYMGGDLISAANRPFVRKFLGGVSQTEQASMVDENGLLSQDGKRRLEAAIVSHAYNDKALTNELFENTESDMKNIAGALLDVAGSWSKMRNTVADDMDVTEQLKEAVNTVRKARKQDQSIQELLNQSDLFSGDLPVETKALLNIFYDNNGRARSRKAVTSTLSKYADLVSSVQSGEGLFGAELAQPKASEILEQANEQVRQTEEQATSQRGLFDEAKPTGESEQAPRERTEQQQPKSSEQSNTKKNGRLTDIDQAANEAATSPTNELPQPTEAQKEAGNYKKGKVKIQGLDISIENPKGSERTGIDSDGKKWSTKMNHHYGDIKKTNGADGDPIDVFIGESVESEKVFVVDQNDVVNGQFDEHKVMIGFNTIQDAKKAYLSNYNKNFSGFGEITETSMSDFKEWMAKPRKSKQPFAKPAETKQVDKASVNIEPTLESHKEFMQRIDDADPSLTANDILEAFTIVRKGVDSIEAELNTLTKANILNYYRGYHDSGMKKAALARSAAGDIVTGFGFVTTNGGMMSISGGGREARFDDIQRKLEKLTDEKLQSNMQATKAEREERIKSYKAKIEGSLNPVTLEDFKNAVRVGTSKKFTPEQWATYDRLSADERLAQQAKDAVKTVAAIQDDVNFTTSETVHSKKGTPLFVVSLDGRVEKELYTELNSRAKSLGGYYSSYRKDGAIPGFQFRTEDDRKNFLSVLDGKAVDKVKEDKDKTESLEALADRIEERATGVVNQDRQTNTARRSSMAAGAISNAEGELGKAAELRRIAEAIKSGEAKYLAKLATGTERDLISSLWRRLASNVTGPQRDELLEQDIVNGNARGMKWKKDISPEQKVRFAEYPLTTMRADSVKRVGNQMLKTKGFKQAGLKLVSEASRVDENDKFNVAGHKYGSKFMQYVRENESNMYIDDVVKDYFRLQRMGVTTGPMLRAALLEYNAITSTAKKTKVSNATTEKLKYSSLQGKYKENDFFNSTSPVVKEVMAQAQLKIGMKVLEPSAGAGHLADGAAEIVGIDNVETFEIAFGLQGFLKDKGYKVTGGDFLEQTPTADYDAVVMNPPFSKDQEITHIEHAFKFLKPGGRLVAVTSTMAGERSNKRNIAFKEWLESLDAEQTNLPQGVFKDAINSTNVNSKVIVIDKPTDGILFNKSTKSVKNGVPLAQAKAETNKFIDYFKGVNDKDFKPVVTDKKPSELFGPTIAADDNFIKGAFDKTTNTLFIFSQNHEGSEDVRRTLREELLVHKGLSLLQEKEVSELFSAINGTRESTNPAIHKIWKDIEKNYGNETELVQAEEFLGKVAQDKPKLVGKYWNNLVAAITKIMRRMGLVKPGVTLSEMRSVVYKIGDKLRRGVKSKTPPKRTSGTRFNTVMKSNEGSSILTDSKGRPISLYHGTNANFDTFDPETMGGMTRASSAKRGFFFTDSKELAEVYATTAIVNNADLDLIYSELELLDDKKFKNIASKLDISWSGLFKNKEDIEDDRYDVLEEIFRRIEQDSEALVSDDYIGIIEKLSPFLKKDTLDSRVVKQVNLKMEKPLIVEGATNDQYEDGYVSDLLDEAREKGHDGVILKNHGDHPLPQDKDLNQIYSDVYIVFSSDQVVTSQSNDIRFNRQFPENFVAPIEKKMSFDYFKRKIQDKFAPLKDLQVSIEGVTGQSISDDKNVYLAEELYYGKTESDLRKVEEKFVKPLTDVMLANNIDQNDLDMYLIAKHAPERNSYIASINPELQDGGSGMTDQQASSILKEFDSEGKVGALDKVAKEVYKITAKRRSMMREAGLESPETMDIYDTSYEYYVPLKGYADDSEGNAIPRTGKGFDIRGNENMKALGRRSMSESPIGHAIKDLTETIIRSRKNEVGNTLLKLVEANPNKDVWEIFTDANPDTERKMVNGEVKEDQPIDMRNRKDDYFAVKREGLVNYIKLKDKDKLLIKAMRNMGAEEMNGLTKAMSAVTRWLSMVNTSLNPEFTITNFSRDIQTALFNALAEQDISDGKVKDKKVATKMIKGAPKAVRALWKHSRGTLDKSDPMFKWINEFLDDGAKTGYFDSKDVNQIANELSGLLEMGKGTKKGQLLRGKKLVLDFIENGNSAIENGVRLSAYIEARNAGVSNVKAASFAKNLTVNFNRKGEVGTVLNSLYMFFNAAVQGNANFARSVLTPAKDENTGKRKLNTAQKFAAGITTSAIGFALLSREMGGEDEDGVPYWDKVPKGVRERNLVILKSLYGGEPGEYWKIPLPYGYNIFYNLGDAAEAAMNSKTRSAGDLTAEMALSVYGSFIPLGSPVGDNAAESLLLAGVPTIAKPAAELTANKNFFGGDIYRENLAFGPQKADAEMSMRSTGSAYKAIARFLNDATGGSTYKSGAIDISPDSIEHMMEFSLGGLYRFSMRTADNANTAVKGGRLELTKMPFTRQVSGKVMPYQDISDFYDARQEMKNLTAEFKSLKGNERSEFRRENAEKLKLQGLMSSLDKRMKQLRGKRDRIESNDELSFAEQEAKLDEVREQMKQTVARFNQRWNETN